MCTLATPRCKRPSPRTHTSSPGLWANLTSLITSLSGGLQDLLPGILNQLGPDNLSNLKEIASQYRGDEGGEGGEDDDDDDDDDVPDLVDSETFDESS